jgi:chitodextrinase
MALAQAQIFRANSLAVGMVVLGVISASIFPTSRLLATNAVIRIQSTSAAAHTGSGNTISVTLPSPTVSGHELVVAVSDYYGTDAPYVISDTYGNTWHLAAAYLPGPYAAIFYAENITGGSSHQIIATANKTGAFPIISVVEYAGLATSQSLDVTASGNAAGTSYASPSVTITQAGDFLFAVHHTNGSASAIFTPTSPWTTVQLQSDGSNHEHQTQDRAATSAGSYVSNGTLPESLTVQSVIAAFKAGSSSDTTPPSTPTNLTATAVSSSQINLSWNASTDSAGVAGYLIFRNGSQVGTSTTTSYSDPGLTVSTTYTYAVAAYDAAANVSAQSATATATTQSAGPSAPANLTATAISSSQINLSWSASTDAAGVTGYKVFRNGSRVGTSTTTSYSDSGLTASTAYTYTVAAYDAAGNVSSQSASASATTVSSSTVTGIPTTWNTGHPRLPYPNQSYLLALAANSTEMAKYNAAAASLDPTNPTSNMGQFRRALIAYLANQVAGNTALATAQLTTFEQLANLGGTWGQLVYSVNDGVGTGTYTLTSASANFLTGCNGGTCVNGNYVLSIQGRKYNIVSATANTIVLAASDNPPPAGTGLQIRIFNGYQGYVGIRMAMVYDWLYNFLDVPDRTAFMNQLEGNAEIWEEYYSGLDASPYNDQIYIENGPDGFIAAFAIYPDFDVQNPTGGTCPTMPCGTYHMNWMINKLFNVFVPVWQQVFGVNGGAWSEDWSQYANNNPGLDQWLVPILLSWQSASTQPYFAQNLWLENYPTWTMYVTRPDFTMEHIGEVAAGTLTPEYNINYDLGAGLGSLNGLAEIYNNPVFRGWARLVNREFSTGPSGFEPSAWPFYTPDNQSNPVSSRTTLPTSKYFDGWGVVFARSGWTENDTDVSLKYGDNFWSHAHADAGSFTISHRGNLAIESGTYRAGSNSEHEIQYGKQSISQNTLLIIDPNDVYPTQQFGQVDLNTGSSVSEAMANDGGQRRAGTFYNQLFPQYVSPDCLNRANTPGCINDWQSEYDYYHMGTLLSYTTTPNYTYASVDITPAYNNPESITTPNSVNRTERAQSVIRNMLFIPTGTSAYIVVYDEVNSTNPAFQKKWLLHSINQPIISGNHYEIDRTENVAQSINWTNPYAANLAYANGGTGAGASYQYNGKLLGWMISPNGGNVNIVGGPGKEFWIPDPQNPGTGTNWNGCMQGQCSGPYWGFLDTSSTPDIVTPTSTSGPIEPGSWRIEETPSTQEEQDYFLNVILATDYNNTNVPATVTGTSSSNSLGATWSDANNTYTVSFPLSGSGGNITITGLVNVNQPLAGGSSTTPPSVPANLSATAASSGQINLVWSASTDTAGVTGYNVFRNGSQVGTSTTTSYSDTGLNASTTYTYAVAAYDAAGNVSVQSATVSATTTAGSGSGVPIPNGTWTMVPTNGFPEAIVGYDNLVYASGIKKFVMWDNYHNMTSESNQAYLAYDFSTNRWDVWGLGGDFNGPDIPASGHQVGLLQFDPNLSVFINYCCFSGSQQYESSQQVWQFDPSGQAGRNKQTSSRPGNTTEASAVFDTEDNVYVLFDRGTGTWIYNPVTNTFTKMTPSGTPPNTVANSAGYFGSLTYDSANNNIYLFGGTLGNGSYTNDLYTYNVPSNTWTKLSPGGTLPSGRQFAGFAYDSADNIFLMVGGDGVAGYLNDTWVYDPTADTWSQLSPTQSPAVTPGSTTFQRLAYDPDDNVFVLTRPGTGGFASGQPTGYGAVQTWFFRYAGTGNNVGYAGNPTFAPTSGSLNRNANAWANEPVLASNGSTLYAGWIETGLPLATDSSLYPHPFVSQLSGSTWTNLGTSYLALDSEFSGYDEAHDPSMALVGGVPWISWNKENNDGNLLPNSLYAKYWNGLSWIGGTVGAVTGGASDTASYSQIVGVGSTPYIAFLETERSCFPYCNNVFVKQWNGSAWSLVGAGQLNRNAQSSSVSPHAVSVSMATDGTYPYVAWTEFAAASTLQSETAPQVYVDQWNGSSWAQLGGSLNIVATDWAYDVSIAYLGGQPYVAWTERSQTGNTQVFVKTWNGSAWALVGTGTLNRNTSTGWAETPSLTANAGNLYLAWTEQQNLGQKVQTYVDAYSNGSWSTLGGTLNADPLNGSAERVSLVILNGQPVAAWGEVKNGSLRNIYVKQWNGSAWVAPGANGAVLNACDLNGDGVVNAADVQIAINQALGAVSCSNAALQGNGVCTVVDVQRVINASLGGACVTGP